MVFSIWYLVIIELSFSYNSLSIRRERIRVRGILSPPPLSPLKGEEIKEEYRL